MDNKKLFEIVAKEVVTIKEFQFITTHDAVSTVTYCEEGISRHPECTHYLVRFIDGDSASVYVKRN